MRAIIDRGYVLWRTVHRSIGLFVLLLLCHPGWALEPITLEEAINTALSNNPTLKQFQLRTNLVDLSAGIAQSKFELTTRPLGGVRLDKDTDTSGFYGLSLEKKTRYGTEIKVRGLNESVLGSERQNRLTIEFSQPLFRLAGKLVNEENIVQARQSHRTSLRDLELSRSRLVVAVVEAFEQVMRLEQQLVADQQALKRAASLYKLTLAKERLGRTTRIDTLRVQLQQGQAISRRSNTQEQLSSSKRVLGELMGLNSDILPTLRSSPEFELEIETLEQATEIALANRLEIAQAQQQYNDTIRATRIAKKYLQPNLTVVARYDYAESNLFFDQNLNGSHDAWSVRLESDTGLNRTREKLEYKQSLLQQTRALENIRAVHLSIIREVELRLLAYHRAHNELTVLEGNFQHAGARLKLARRLFRIGRSDGFSVTDAEHAFFTAQSLWFSGKSEALINGYRLLNATGTLIETPNHLRPRVL